MGADWYSITCIGLKVPKKKIITKEMETMNLCGCDPKINPDDYPKGKYCPNCGRLIRRQVEVNKPLFDTFVDGYSNDGKTKIMGWPVMYDTDIRNFYICIFTSGLSEYEKMSPVPLIAEETLAKFNADMREVGLWDKDQFGLWTVTYCSY